MRRVELALAVLFLLLGVRSLWVWGRRPFEGRAVADHVLYALYLTGRIGLWFAIAGFFWIYATLEVQGRAALDELAEIKWYILVPIGLAGMQLVAGWFLGRRPDNGPISPQP